MSTNVDDLDKEALTNEFSYVYSQVKTPPPPGFSVDSKVLFDSIINNRAGAGSAPPGAFMSHGISLLGNDSDNPSSDFSGFPTHDHLRMMLRPTDDQSQRSANGQSSSILDLAACLGEGLAESMGDSLIDKKENSKISRLSNAEQETAKMKNTTSQNNMNSKNGGNGVEVDMVMDNFARQSRHTLTHLVGSTAGLSLKPRELMNNSQNKSTKTDQSYLRDRSYRLHEQNGTAYRNGKADGNIVTIIEPGNTPSPAPHQLCMNLGTKDIGTNKIMQISPSPSRFGRSSAPPQVFDNNISSYRYGTNSAALRQHTANKLQQRAAELRAPRRNPPHDYTPSPTLSNDTTQFSPSPQPPLSETEQELESFTWRSNLTMSQNNISSNMNSPSRALAIFGVSQLPVSEVRSTCEAFGSLLYFRSEFCNWKNVIFIAYHDLRGACQASNELNAYLQNIASSSLNEVDSSYCKENLKIMYSVSLAASSELDDSAIVFSNIPYNVDIETVTQLMTSFGGVQSVDSYSSDNKSPSNGACYVVRFYDIQDANHCMLEMQSTIPWGPTVHIKSQRRSDSERQQGQELLALTSKWRMASRTSNSTTQSAVPRNIATSRRLSNTSTPSLSPNTTSATNEVKKVHHNSTPSTESSSPPLQFAAQAPQLVVGPDGQYSYVIVQPNTYQAPTTQYVQNGAVLAPHMPVAHQPHPIPTPQYIFDGQNYWLQNPPPVREHTMTNPHLPAYHQMPNQQIAYQVMPVYPVANPNGQHVQTDSSLSSGSSQNQGPHYINGNRINARVQVPEITKETNGRSNSSNQHNFLDIEAVKQGWDVRTSLMIRNIPNKYTRSMLLAEFKDCNHGPGMIDFFYLPIDFRNKCNRGYAFVNFVNYRDIVTFYHTYNGKGWKTFKSDKICEITYARIQGKASMLKRFQNSALMEKDPEYRPVVFNAQGEVCPTGNES